MLNVNVCVCMSLTVDALVGLFLFFFFFAFDPAYRSIRLWGEFNFAVMGTFITAVVVTFV